MSSMAGYREMVACCPSRSKAYIVKRGYPSIQACDHATWLSIRSRAIVPSPLYIMPLTET
jgi:hypothetical protein